MEIHFFSLKRQDWHLATKTKPKKKTKTKKRKEKKSEPMFNLVKKHQGLSFIF